MNNKHLAIIIAALLLLVALAGSYFILTSQPQYKNITMNGITMEVPESNVSVIQQTDLFSIYNDTENSVDVLVYDSTDAKLSDMTDAVTFASIRDTLKVGSIQQTSDNFTYNYSDTTKVYTYVGNYSHKNIFIATKNKEDLIHILQSINVDVNVSLNETNQTNQTVTKTQSKKASTSTEEPVEREDEQVIDGWDPKEHEVSREKLDDDLEKVHYDDDYFRIVDSNGKVVSYGY